MAANLAWKPAVHNEWERAGSSRRLPRKLASNEKNVIVPHHETDGALAPTAPILEGVLGASDSKNLGDGNRNQGDGMKMKMQTQNSSINPGLRVTLTVIAMAVLAIVTTPATQAQTYMFNRADYATGVGPVTLAI